MIFVTLGSQKFQFNRLLVEIDRLVEEKKIKEPVFAQIGYSDYIPKNYQYSRFVDRDNFNHIMNNCNKVITHGGTGAIINAVKLNKKVIAIARLKEFNEHVDNHQLQIIKQFDEMKLIIGVEKIENLEKSICDIKNINLKKYSSNTNKIIENLDMYIKSI